MTLQPEHDGLTGSIDIGIQQADPRALRRPRDREVHGNGGLADPSLARGDRDNVGDAGKWGEAALHRMRGDLVTQLEDDLGDGTVRREQGREMGGEQGFERRSIAARRKTELDL